MRQEKESHHHLPPIRQRQYIGYYRFLFVNEYNSPFNKNNLFDIKFIWLQVMDTN